MVTVIIPNYNHHRFLLKRLQTVQQQTVDGFECFVLDDNSTDDSRELIDGFVKSDVRFSCVFNTENSGSTFAQWNKGVRLAAGEYIWIAESDDAADPSLLEQLVARLDADPSIVLAYCQSNRMNEKGIVTGTWKTYTDDLDQERFATDFVMEGKDYIHRFLIHKNTIPNASAVVFRKDIYEQVGAAPEHLKNNGDWLTWLKMLCYGKVAFVAKPLNYFRYHEQSVIATLYQGADNTVYKEQFDYSMREKYTVFLKEQKINASAKMKRMNAAYMALEKGNEGLFYLQKGEYMKGWERIAAASFYPTIQTGFIKRAIRRK
ncbi:MAG: glycosyltransferase [Chitinophagaceae bacterium]|nr:glycosyltransferase [Chitinophagaceae bacterium]